MNTSILHIKVKPKTAQDLKLLSKKRSMPVGELVRLAISRWYQFDSLELTDKHRLALAAFQGGYISIGKLAEEMGSTIIETRKWLIEHDIPQNSSFSENDIKNAC